MLRIGLDDQSELAARRADRLGARSWGAIVLNMSSSNPVAMYAHELPIVAVVRGRVVAGVRLTPLVFGRLGHGHGVYVMGTDV